MSRSLAKTEGMEPPPEESHFGDGKNYTWGHAREELPSPAQTAGAGIARQPPPHSLCLTSRGSPQKKHGPGPAAHTWVT